MRLDALPTGNLHRPLRLAIPWLLAAAMVVGWCNLARADEEEIGFVLEVTGTWKLEGKPSRKIAAGDKLPAGGILIPAPRTEKSQITVCLFTGEAKPYHERTPLPERVEPSLTSRVWGYLSGNYRGGIVHAIARGEDLNESVLPLADGKLDVSALVADLPAGKYLLQFAPPGADGPKNAGVTLAVDWKPKTKVAIPAATLEGGLYRVRLLNGRTRAPTGAEAFALIASADRYAIDRQTLEEVAALTETWDEEIQKVARRGALRACLESLAAGNGN